MNWLVNQFIRELEGKWTEFTFEMVPAIAEEKMRIGSDEVGITYSLFRNEQSPVQPRYRISALVWAKAAPCPPPKYRHDAGRSFYHQSRSTMVTTRPIPEPCQVTHACHWVDRHVGNVVRWWTRAFGPSALP
jgi:hypothetical protein